MKITIPHPQLKEALEIVSRISTKHATLPILQCVVIEATDTGVLLKATNLEIGIELPVPADVHTPGVLAVPAITLLQSIQFLSEKSVTLLVEDGVLRVESLTTKTSIKSIPHDDFPTIHKVPEGGVMISADLFAFGCKTVAFASSQTSIKPELGSIFVQQKREHTLTFVATDSFRLMEKTVPQKGVVLTQSFLLPAKNALELARICESLGGSAELSITDNQCSVRFSGGAYITSRLVIGSFPDYEQIIPKEYVTQVTILKEDLLRALKKTSVFLNKFLQVTMAVTEHHLTVSANNSEVGHVTDTVRTSVEGQELQLSFNQQYVVESLAHLQDESLILRFAGIGRPLVVTGVHDTSVRYLVMPMNK